MQYPYCDWNRYNGSREVIERKLNKHMEITHLISNNNHALNMLLNIYGTDWWMDFVYKEGTVDVDFHRNNLGFCTGAMCGVIEKNLENYKSDAKFCIFSRNAGEYEPFWELLKMNLLEKQPVNLMMYRIRSTTIRLEESTGRVSFTNNQAEVELYLNRVIKNKEAILGDLRIRKDDDEWPKDEFSKKIITLNDEEIRVNATKSYREKINIRKKQEGQMEIKEEKLDEKEQSIPKRKKTTQN
jgi:hypothetical protein